MHKLQSEDVLKRQLGGMMRLPQPVMQKDAVTYIPQPIKGVNITPLQANSLYAPSKSNAPVNKPINKPLANGGYTIDDNYQVTDAQALQQQAAARQGLNLPKIQGTPISWYQTFNWDKWGDKDYSQAQNFNQAFSSARSNQDKEFVYKDKRYTTNLVPKALDNVQDSKHFLTDYYNNLYPKLQIGQQQYTSTDSLFARVRANELLKPYTTPINKTIDSLNALPTPNYDASNKAYDKLSQYYTQAPDKFSPNQGLIGNRVTDQLLKLAANRNNPLTSLNRPSYFSMTTQKGNRHEDGYTKPNGDVYLTMQANNMTTAIHELTHKSDDDQRLRPLVNQNQLVNQVNKAPNRVQIPNTDVFSYVSNPTELNARHQSTRYWLSKNYPNYKLSDNITPQQIQFIQSKGSGVPYDIRQLMEIYGKDPDYIMQQFKKF